MFFKELIQIMSSGTDVNLVIHRHNETLTVSVLPKKKGLKDEAYHHLQPIVLSGTAEEMDAAFFETIRQPVQNVTGLLTNMKSFEDSLTRTQAERKEVQERKKNAEKEAAERKAKFDKLIVRAEAQENEGKNDDALQTLREARTLAADSDIRKTNDRINQLKSICQQKTLF